MITKMSAKSNEYKVIFENSWNQKKRYTGLEEYYNLIKQVCKKTDNVNLLGLFQPQTESWNWTYFIEVTTPNTMNTWQKVVDEVNHRNKANRENITNNSVRWYHEIYTNPKPAQTDELKYLQIELNIWDDINIGIKDYHNAHITAFKGQKDVWYQGNYRVWNEPYHSANFYWFKDWIRMREMSDISWRLTGQPERVKMINIRNYERYYLE
jgi:hypothetical protein